MRWFDGIPLPELKPVLDILILISAYAQQRPFKMENIASHNQEWNDVVYKSIMRGDRAEISVPEQHAYLSVLGLADLKYEYIVDTGYTSFCSRMFSEMYQRLIRRDILSKMAPDFELRSLNCIAFNSEQVEFHRTNFS
jgi:hypothetical protein